MTGGHVQVECRDLNCGGKCNACCLSICGICGGAEGSLPMECPGVRMTDQQECAVYAGILDYFDAAWHKIDKEDHSAKSS